MPFNPDQGASDVSLSATGTQDHRLLATREENVDPVNRLDGDASGTTTRWRDMLGPCKMVDYLDKRGWNKRALMACDESAAFTLDEDAGI